MNVDHNARKVAARDLNEHFIGQAFAYESDEGIPMYGRIAFIEDRSSHPVQPVVNVTVDGVLGPQGSSLVMGFKPDVELFFSTPTD